MSNMHTEQKPCINPERVSNACLCMLPICRGRASAFSAGEQLSCSTFDWARNSRHVVLLFSLLQKAASKLPTPMILLQVNGKRMDWDAVWLDAIDIIQEGILISPKMYEDHYLNTLRVRPMTPALPPPPPPPPGRPAPTTTIRLLNFFRRGPHWHE